jgi:hypothetical protein
VEITAALAADLVLLTQALDDPGTDIAETLSQLVSDARLAVRSYLGLTVTACAAVPTFTFTAMDDFAYPADVVSSLFMPLSYAGLDLSVSRLAVILYAARPGAFVDLAADLSWLTGLALGDFAVDQHRHLPAESAADGAEHTASVINQAIGVLLGRGHTVEQAGFELDARATNAGHSRYTAADIILNSLSGGDHELSDSGSSVPFG